MFDSTGEPSGTKNDALNHDDAVPSRGETAEEVVPERSLRKKMSHEMKSFSIVIWFCCAIAVFVIDIMGDLISPKYFAPLCYPLVVPTKDVRSYGGPNATYLFPHQVGTFSSSGIGSGISQHIIQSGADTTSLAPNSGDHDFRAPTSHPHPDRCFSPMYLRYNYQRGFVGKTHEELQFLSRNGRKSIAIFDGSVYDLSDYITGKRVTPTGFSPTSVDSQFMSRDIVQLFQQRAGADMTNKFNALHMDQDHEKFIVIQISCYTEGEESLRRAIDSITQLKSRNKRTRWNDKWIGKRRIVLDISGSDPDQNSEVPTVLSLGEGTKQHNMVKVYSALYESGGHVVPYLVLAKSGTPTERSRRGKRDSQMMINRNQKNLIGFDPAFYEYVLIIDADTTVDNFSHNRMISAMMHHYRIIGLVGAPEVSLGMGHYNNNSAE
ncbi:hypothetical protein PSTG_04554 [Puccinia striiformis f. sp. tritici PST-78]|uniref:Chitin synthase n=1 Tax=Puccinia striiformis f. sp. tritici PST-78 TaxID=1165861 RepID=A0A0L0VTL9_9BASI|nr:hypothetical protein PSTG_04554 [Puccinia striiformis f. sp. tritici PST-78]